MLSFWFCLLPTAAVAIFITIYYAYRSVSFPIKTAVAFSLTLSMICFVLLPFDVSETARMSIQPIEPNLSTQYYLQIDISTNDTAQLTTQSQEPQPAPNEDPNGSSSPFVMTWRLLYFLNLVVCWVILPILQGYEDSGQFTPFKRLLSSLKSNCIQLAYICVLAVIIIVYLLIFVKFSIDQLASVFASILNYYGLALVSIFLGFGLVSVPKRCWTNIDYKQRVNRCHRLAEHCVETQRQILDQVGKVKSYLETNNILSLTQQGSDRRQVLLGTADRNASNLSANIISSEIEYLLELIKANFELDRIHLQSPNSQNYQQCTASQLNSKIKHQILTYKALDSEIEDYLNQLKSVTEQFSQNNYNRRKYMFQSIFVVVAILNGLVLLAEFASFVPLLRALSPLSWLRWSSPALSVANLCLCLYLAALGSSTIFKIKLYNLFSLHHGHSSASSLLFAAINLSRICIPLCYNYLQIVGRPHCGFVSFFGEISLGQKYLFVFPLAMVLIGMLSLFDVFQCLLGYLGFGAFSLDDEDAQDKDEEGKRILMERLRKRNFGHITLDGVQLL